MTYNTSSNRITNSGFQYDFAGNQTHLTDAGGVIKQYRYDSAGRLAQVLNDSGGVLATYTYGASNQRLRVQEGGEDTYYAWDGGAIIAEYSAAGLDGLSWKRSYVYLGGRLLATNTNDGTQYQHPDRLGTRLITSASDGSVISEQVGLPYGTSLPNSTTLGTGEGYQSGAQPNPHKRRFTSYDRSDVTGLDYAVNRHYNVQQGRFTQVDPIWMDAVSLENPQTLNLYAYCGDDPINHNDLDGLFFGFLKKLFGWVGKVLKWITIAVVVAVAVLTIIPAAWTGIALGKILAFSMAHPVLSSLVWLGNSLGFLTPGINGSGIGGVNNFLNNDPPERSWWDWATTDGLQNLSDAIAGFGDTLSLGGTRLMRQAGGYDRAVNPCSGWYAGGEIAGTIHGFAMGGAVGVRNALAVGGAQGSKLARIGKGAARFFRDQRKFSTVSKQYWDYMGGAKGMHLHHWAIPYRAGGPNAGWNLIAIPGRLNSWMNGTGVSQVAEWGIRVAVPGSIVGGAARGGQWGMERQEWKSGSGC